MAGTVILPKHVERNKGKGVYYRQWGVNHPRLVPSSWLLSLHLRSTYASLLCRFESVLTLSCFIVHCQFLFVGVIFGYGLDE